MNDPHPTPQRAMNGYGEWDECARGSVLTWVWQPDLSIICPGISTILFALCRVRTALAATHSPRSLLHM